MPLCLGGERRGRPFRAIERVVSREIVTTFDAKEHPTQNSRAQTGALGPACKQLNHSREYGKAPLPFLARSYALESDRLEASV